MAAKKYFYCADGTNVVGPFSRPETRKLLAAKVIFPDTVLSGGGIDDWKAARFYPELISALARTEKEPTKLADTSFFDSSHGVWRSDIATNRQLARLKFLGARIPKNLTKGEASDMLDQLITPENQVAWDTYKAKTIDRKHNRFLAFCFSVLPGAGHFYKGAWLMAFIWLVVVVAGYGYHHYAGYALHVLCAIRAAR